MTRPDARTAQATPPATDLPRDRSLCSARLVPFVRECVTERRWLHTLAVLHTHQTLARLHDLDPAVCAAAALLHDATKHESPATMRADFERWGTPLDDEWLDFPRTWHGFHAAELAARELGLHDEAVLEAVRLHSTADARIGPVGRALFVADFCAPDRRIGLAEQTLQAAREDLDEGFRRVLYAKSRHVVEVKQSALHPCALRAVRAWLPAGQVAEIEALMPTEAPSRSPSG